MPHTKPMRQGRNTPSSSFDLSTIINKNAAIQTTRDQEYLTYLIMGITGINNQRSICDFINQPVILINSPAPITFKFLF